jgi:tetratricopeptide (TPR) repeat protein
LRPAFYERLSPERQVIALNINSVVNLAVASGLRDAYDFAMHAWRLVVDLPTIRTRGLVARQLASVLSEQVEITGEPSAEAGPYFEEAINIFADEAPNLRETWFEYGRYQRRLGRIYAQRGDDAMKRLHFRKALDCFDNALLVLGAGQPTMYHAELLESKAVVYRWLGDIPAVERLIDEAEAILSASDYPAYAQVIAGTLAYKRGQIAMGRGQIAEAMRMFTMALARCDVFSSDNRTINTFRRRVRRYIIGFSDDQVRSAYQTMRDITNEPALRVEDLPYQRPDPDVWARSWQAMSSYLLQIATATANSRNLL